MSFCRKCEPGFMKPGKHDVTLMSTLQVLQNKAAKIILDRPLYSSASDALKTLQVVNTRKEELPAPMRTCI